MEHNSQPLRARQNQKGNIMTILKYSKTGQTECAGGLFEIVKEGSKYQAYDALTGFAIGKPERSKALADINILNECRRAGLVCTKENTDFRLIQK